jgi:hypothetical protein
VGPEVRQPVKTLSIPKASTRLTKVVADDSLDTRKLIFRLFEDYNVLPWEASTVRRCTRPITFISFLSWSTDILCTSLIGI